MHGKPSLLSNASSHPAAPVPFWRLGFRPFFLSGSAFAVVALLLWSLALSGHSGNWNPLGGVLAWHRHEMPFGFAAAILAGFLLTAVQNWTGRPGLSGRPLIALFALWLCARLAWLAGIPLAITAILELTFLPAVAWVLGRQLWQARQTRNYPMVAIMLLIAACDALSMSGLAIGNDALQRNGALAALWLVACLMWAIGGRVIPFFIQRGLNLPASAPLPVWVDVLGLGLGILIAIALALGLAGIWLALPFTALTVLHGVRLWRWYTHGVWSVPLLWSLLLAYAWMPIATTLMALHSINLPVAASLGHHALAVGGLGGLILAMMARVSLGHSGRPLVPSSLMSIAFAAIQLGALARLLVPIIGSTGLMLAATGWALAFTLFIACYGRILLSARADGQPG